MDRHAVWLKTEEGGGRRYFGGWKLESINLGCMPLIGRPGWIQKGNVENVMGLFKIRQQNSFMEQIQSQRPPISVISIVHISSHEYFDQFLDRILI